MGGVTGVKDFDDAHGRAASRTQQPLGRCWVVSIVVVVHSLSGFDMEKCSRFGEVLGALSVSEEAVMPDAVEAVR